MEDVKDVSNNNMAKVALQNQVKQDKVNLQKIKEIIPDIQESINIAKKLLEIDDSVGVFILGKFKKIRPDYEYETDERYESLMFQKQELLNKRNHMNAVSQIREMEKKLEESKDRIEYYEMTIRMREEDIEKMGE